MPETVANVANNRRKQVNTAGYATTPAQAMDISGLELVIQRCAVIFWGGWVTRIGEPLKTRARTAWAAELRLPPHRKSLDRRIRLLTDQGQHDLVRQELERWERSRCGARNRRGTPCQRQGKGRGGRCSNHGGASTGARTPEGKLRALRNLRPFKGLSDDELRERFGIATGGD